MRRGRTALLAAAGLGALAVANAVLARRAERLHPPAGRFVEVDGVRLHLLDRGAGPPVVLLHGDGALVADWEASGLLDALARRHRVIAFDRPGSGHSARPRGTWWTPGVQAALLARALDRLGVRRPVLLGHSWGALVALSMALDTPVEAAGLVLLGGYVIPTPRADALLVSALALPGLGNLLSHTVLPLAGRFVAGPLLRMLFAPRPVDPRFRAGFPLGMALRPSQLRASLADTAYMIPSAAGLVRRYGDLALPVVLIAGSDDRQVDTDEQSRRLHALVPGSRLVVLDGLGHMMHYDAAGRIAEIVGELAAA